MITIVPIDTASAGRLWEPTKRFRWHRPKGGADTDKVLEQLFVSDINEREWREIETFLED